MHHYLIGSVLINISGLFLIYIKTNTKELVESDAFDQLIGINQCSTGSITSMTPSFIFLMFSILII